MYKVLFKEANHINNQEILKKARQEKTDEREEYIKNKAFNIGWISVSAIILVLILLRLLNNESANDLLMIIMAQTAASSFYQYAYMRDRKIYLVAGIISTIAVLLSLAALLSQYGVF
ncbi:hypothetical protein SAMN04488134_101269 [Amphibacillus marinus]|uniref:Uncharacterized protein n=1 Tax=Amphibacillus marinus TaxID=872970 RepID=A0A1H8H711_9BACI|nr:DUF6442 family protein [Amphibacillus marinus]SEN51905.1 hypothetical protein SAMN04488134_101269 [Amphibacillus marinus]